MVSLTLHGNKNFTSMFSRLLSLLIGFEGSRLRWHRHTTEEVIFFFAESMKSFAVILWKKEKSVLMFNKNLLETLTNDKDINILEEHDKEPIARKIIHVITIMMKPCCLTILISRLALLWNNIWKYFLFELKSALEWEGVFLHKVQALQHVVINQNMGRFNRVTLNIVELLHGYIRICLFWLIFNILLCEKF